MKSMTKSNAARFLATFVVGATLLFCGGCVHELITWSGEESSLEDQLDLNEYIREMGEEEEKPTTRLVGNLATPWGVHFAKVEAVGIVTGLDGTGSDPSPSAQREMLIGEMRTRHVGDINKILRDPSTSMVILRGFVAPGAQRGDRLDVEVRTPINSDTTSLAGGWLMQSRMKELAVLGGRVREGKPLALAGGPVVLDETLGDGDSEDPRSKIRGRILGGARLLETRPLGLSIRPQHYSGRTTMAIGRAVNARFHVVDRGNKRGVANPKDDKFIELTLPRRYKHNVARFMRVVQAIAVGETPTERVERITRLEAELSNPATAAEAALQLEAIGKEGVEVLARALEASSAEIQFYAAEALAYLDESRAAKPLATLAAREPAFRWHCLTALSSMDDGAAFDELDELMAVSSAETRYGAFKALRARSPGLPSLAGETLDERFALHVMQTPGDKMIHFSQTRRPEIVLFGGDQRLQTPLVLFCGREVTVKSDDDGRLRVSRFIPGEATAQVSCDATSANLVRALGEVGADYDDILKVMQQAKDKDLLHARLVVGAVPRAGRTYQRSKADRLAMGQSGEVSVDSPLPSLFFNRGYERSTLRTGADFDADAEEDPPQQEDDEAQSSEGFFGKISSWFTG